MTEKRRFPTAEEAFYQIFPKDRIQEIEAIDQGEALLDPFQVMSSFDANFTDDKQKRDYVLARLSQTNFGNVINFFEKDGETKIFSRNVEPLLKALHSIYLHGDIIDCLPPKAKEEINIIFSNRPLKPSSA